MGYTMLLLALFFTTVDRQAIAHFTILGEEGLVRHGNVLISPDPRKRRGDSHPATKWATQGYSTTGGAAAVPLVFENIGILPQQS